MKLGEAELGPKSVKLTSESRILANAFIKNPNLHNITKITVKAAKMLIFRYAEIYEIPIDVSAQEMEENVEIIYPIKIATMRKQCKV